MTHRIREAMRDDSGELLGSDGGPVEADETFTVDIINSTGGAVITDQQGVGLDGRHIAETHTYHSNHVRQSKTSAQGRLYVFRT